ncbi:MAG TPA: beta-propeller domain-containing protein, partial [Humisphaera sp.]
DGRDAFVRDLADGTAGQNLTTVAMIDTGDAAAGPTATSTVAGWGGEVYASTGAIYLASGEWDASGSVTRLFKFDLAPDGVPLAATGQVPGSILSQYSMDESGGYFRVATNVWDAETGGQSNGVYVLGESGDKLEVVGSVTGIAKGESLRSSRFAGDRAYVVTFRQVDPLFSLDLSDPRDPQVTGEVKVPGFSSYLFPVSDTLLIGVGRDVDPDTQADEGLQVSLFDVSDPDAPKRVAAETLAGPFSYSEAEYEPHAFAYFADERVMTLPLGPSYGGVVAVDGSTVGSAGGSASTDGSLLVVSVDPSKGAGAFEKLGEVATPGGVRRAVRIDSTVFAVGDTHIRSAVLTDPADVLDTVALSAG